MDRIIHSQDELTHEENAGLIIDFMHRTIMHHAFWFAEVMHRHGREKALEVMKTAYDNSYAIQMKRLSKVLGYEMQGTIPKPLLDLPPEKMQEMKEAVAANWLANDGVLFQALEFTKGMFDAKRCNDSSWAQFSPFEAWSVKRFLNLPDNPGLDGLKRALNFRLYATINKQSLSEETDNSFVFKMNDCRVQNARKRKGLDDYPCKSGGMVEYTTFAETIDPRIKTECICCPPDNHPDEWFCAWRFYIDNR
ncbi:MAG: cytosolic protein [Bacteroidetes bacterium]|nr:cytosolic protein [Bacteroidota bacterium]